MTVCRLCRKRIAVRTLIITMPGGNGGAVAPLCRTCARALIPEEDWPTFGIEEEAATIDLYGPPRYVRSRTDDHRWRNLAEGLTGGIE